MMRILLLAHAFNSLTQRLYVELARDGHILSVELDIHDRVTEEAVALFRPDVILAPFLKRAIPPRVWQHTLCLIVHPGPAGDGGPSALDWAILEDSSTWGVTVLQAEADFDAGPAWSTVAFRMRAARKSSLYHHEVTESAVMAVRLALGRVESCAGPLETPTQRLKRQWRPAMRQSDRAIDWAVDDTRTVIRKIDSADGFPGLEDRILERRFRLFDAHPEFDLSGVPGALIGQRYGAICRATRDGGVWIGQLQPMDETQPTFKQPATLAIGDQSVGLPNHTEMDHEIRYEERRGVGYLHFEFYNGALSVEQSERLRRAYAAACRRPTRVIVLMGGGDFWCNGMHLHCIEASASPADASWSSINAINDVARDILLTGTHLTIAALQGNAAAGGVFLALATDRVLARSGCVLNPHYRNMGNLHGSEYWTYVLPKRVGPVRADAIVNGRLPLSSHEALRLGLIDAHAGANLAEFRAFVESYAEDLAGSEDAEVLLSDKRRLRENDERLRPLDSYREEELAHMKIRASYPPCLDAAASRLASPRSAKGS